ncbi:transporter [Lyngbya aestuarii]|uniref:transporter n=1 Tax=Lyngbya aestuarii TaxID=118322 RepID=UPI00403D58E2
MPITATANVAQESTTTLPQSTKNNAADGLILEHRAELLEPITAKALDQSLIDELTYPELGSTLKTTSTSDAAINIRETDTPSLAHSSDIDLENSPVTVVTDEMSLLQPFTQRQVQPEKTISAAWFSTDNLDNHHFMVADGNGASEPGKWTSARPDGHAPISVMGEHTHSKGEFMLSYRYMFMDMDGNRDGTDSLSDSEVLDQFPVTPVRMTMQMHMLGAMYAPSDELTLMAMVPYIFQEMDHRTRAGVRFTTNSDGFGDIQTTALYKVFDQDRQRIHFNFGLSFPTGSIEERDDTPAGDNQILPYPMQIGSGTFDLLPGVTYLGQNDQGSWGAQALGTLRLGENSNDYRLGNQLQLTGWIARNWTDSLSTSIRLKGRTWGNIDGADDRLNPMMIPTADPDRRGGTQLDLGLGLNLYAPSGNLRGSRFAIEFELPLYRSLEGPQLETDWQLTAGLQAVF